MFLNLGDYFATISPSLVDSIEFYDVNGSSLTRTPDLSLVLYSKFQSVYVAFKSGGNTDDEIPIKYSSLRPGKNTGGNN